MKNIDQLDRRISNPLKVLLILCISFAAQINLWAQPTLLIGSASPNAGDNFCVPVRVVDFTDITEMSFSIQFNPALVTALNVSNINPLMAAAGFNASNITIDNVAGVITVSGWSTGPCTDPNIPAVTLGSGIEEVLIFDLCFQATGSYGQQTRLQVTNQPVPIVVYRKNVLSCINIGFQDIDSSFGTVTIGVRPLSIQISDVTASPGDQVCVDFVIEQGWDNLASLQFSVNYDPAFLEFQSLIHNDNIPNLAGPGQSFGVPGVGSVPLGAITCSWAAPISTPGISVPDSTTMFQACFNVIGLCESISTIQFTQSPRPLEITNNIVQGLEIPFESNVGTIITDACDPTGIQLVIDCGEAVNLNDQICVQIKAGSNFTGVRRMEYLMQWNPNVLEFVSVGSFNLTGLNASAFNTSNTDDGFLGLEWAFNALPSGVTRSEGQILYQVCFNVIGLGGDSPVNIIRADATGIVAPSSNIGINPSNCIVHVIQPNGVGMLLGDAQAVPGDLACIPFNVVNFENIISYQFSFNWDPAVWTFQNINGINLPGATLANFNTNLVDAGGLLFEWSSAGPVSLSDGQSLFNVCFTPAPTASPDDCDLLDALGFPLINEAVSSNSNGENIGIVTTPANLCVLYPEGYGLAAMETTGDWRDTVCMPFTVASFDDILSTGFSVSWNPLELTYVNTQINPLLAGLNVTASNAPIGSVDFQLNSPSPLTLPDQTVAFEVCFELSGPPRACYEVSIEDTNVTTVNGTGSVTTTQAAMCIRDRIVVDSVIIVPETCAGRGDASVRLVVAGGRQPYGTSWTLLSSGENRFQPLSLSNQISTGFVAYTVYDFSGPSLSVTDTIFIPLLNNAPPANAGPDRNLPCSPPLLLVSCQGSNPDYVYSWQRVDAPNQPSLNGCSVFLSEPGSYQLTAIDQNGCIGLDTMRVLPRQELTAGITLLGDSVFTCATQSTTLGIAPNTTSGPSIRYNWETVIGGPVDTATLTANNFVVFGPGRYRLVVRNLFDGCRTDTTINIIDGRPVFFADAGESLFQSCTNEPAVFDGSGTFYPDLNLTYSWLDPDGNVISDSIRAEASELGIYTFIASDPVSSCESVDYVELQPNPDAPVSEAGDDQLITCATTQVTLNGAVSPPDGNYQIQWTATAGGSLQPGTQTELQPVALTAGRYVLQIVNLDNNCRSADTVFVQQNTVAPVANAGSNQVITCSQPSVLLNGSASSQGDTILYAWYLNNINNPISGAAADSLRVTSQGSYLLQVTNLLNSCSSFDTVVVSNNTQSLTVSLSYTGTELRCNNPVATIGSTITPAGAPFSGSWSVVSSGNIVGPTNGNTIQINQPGVYRLTVTRTDNGCVSTGEFTVSNAGITLPVATIAQDSAFITCLEPQPVISGTGSATGANISYQWNNQSGGNAAVSPTNLTTAVTGGGIYQLQVTNTTTGCRATDSIRVIERNQLPLINMPQQVGPVTCDNQAAGVPISPVVTTLFNTFTATWSGIGGGTPTVINQPATAFTQPGSYQLLIRNTTTGCESRDTVTVTGNLNRPTFGIAAIPDFICTSTTVGINATGSGNPNSYRSIGWTSLNPLNTVSPASGSLLVNVNGPGQYRLTLTFANNGCFADTLVTVADNRTPPLADAGDNLSLECGETSMLDGSGSSTGNSFTYRWSTLSGSPIVADSTTLTPMVSGAGSYQLIVTNTVNGCRDTAAVSSSLVFPPDAQAGSNLLVCGDTALISGNLPAGTTGLWTAAAAVTFANASAAQTTLSGLPAGTTLVFWTLSAPGCPNYSRDELQVSQAASPLANQDAIAIPADGPRNQTINVLDNDLLNGASALTLRLLTLSTPIGLLDTSQFANGQLTFFAPQGVGGTTEVLYQICSVDCPERCAIGRVLINAEQGEIGADLPNTITPNGDGLNDVLIFDIIQYNPVDKFPNNELIVFNRWGDIVYTQAPYANQWGGEGKDGSLLPEGTYYYILRLDISEGIILRGDITIVR
jgi:gliding motility-associated-like protein